MYMNFIVALHNFPLHWSLNTKNLSVIKKIKTSLTSKDEREGSDPTPREKIVDPARIPRNCHARSNYRYFAAQNYVIMQVCLRTY